jgi:uncharacterized delta-60 repeat protein
MKTFLGTCLSAALMLLGECFGISAEFAYATSFEASEGYTIGPLDGQRGWTLIEPGGEFAKAEVRTVDVSHTGANAVVIENRSVFQTARLVLRRALPRYALRGSVHAVGMAWAPLSNTPVSRVSWRIPYSGSQTTIKDYEFYGAVLGSGWGEGFPCGVGFETGLGGSVYSDIVPAGALLRWNLLSSDVLLETQLVTGESVTLLTNSVSNETGTIRRSIVEPPDADGYAGWIDIAVEVSPRATVAIDTIRIRIQSKDALLLPDDFLGVSLARHRGSGVVDKRFVRPEFRSKVSLWQCIEDTAGGLIWASGPHGLLNAANHSRCGIVRTDSAGNVDRTAATAPLFTALSGAVLGPDGGVYVAGSLPGDTGQAGREYYRVKRLSEAGEIDSAYESPAFDSIGRFMVVGKDARVIVTSGGLAPTHNGGLIGVYRLDPDGSLDTGFGSPTVFQSGIPDASSIMAEPVIDNEGRILIGGSFDQVNDVSRTGVVRLLDDGRVDPTFVPTGYTFLPYRTVVRCMAVQSDGRIILGGRGFYLDDDSSEYMLIRLQNNGTVDRSFRSIARGTGGDSSRTVRALRVLPDGRLILAGETVLRIFPDGTIDNSLISPIPTAYSLITSIALPDPNRILLMGGLSFSSPKLESDFACLTSVGDVDTTFNSPLLQSEEFPYGAALTPGGGLLVWGGYDWIGRDLVPAVSRVRSDGSQDESFRIAVTNTSPLVSDYIHLATNVVAVRDLQAMSDGGFYAVVDTGDQYGNPAASGLWKFMNDGAADPAFLGQGRAADGIERWQDDLLCWHNDFGYNVFSFQKVHPDGAVDPNFVAFRSQLGEYLFTASQSIERYTVGAFDVVGVSDREPGQIVVSVTEPYTEDDYHRFRHRLYLMGSDGSNPIEFGAKPLPGKPGSEGHPEIYNPLTGTFEQPRVIYSGGSPYNDARFLTDGRLLIAGVLDEWKGGEPLRLARMTAGNYDPTFHVRISRGEGRSGEAAAEVHSVYVDASNRVWITGNFTHVNGVGRGGLARLDTDGALDTTFDPAVEYLPFTSHRSGLAADANGTLYLWGTYRQQSDLWPYGITKFYPADPLVLGVPTVNALTVDLSISSSPASAVVTERSVDLMIWTAISTNQVTTETDSVRIPRSDDAVSFYRLREVE